MAADSTAKAVSKAQHTTQQSVAGGEVGGRGGRKGEGERERLHTVDSGEEGDEVSEDEQIERVFVFEFVCDVLHDWVEFDVWEAAVQRRSERGSGGEPLRRIAVTTQLILLAAAELTQHAEHQHIEVERRQVLLALDQRHNHVIERLNLLEHVLEHHQRIVEAELDQRTAALLHFRRGDALQKVFGARRHSRAHTHTLRPQRI